MGESPSLTFSFLPPAILPTFAGWNLLVLTWGLRPRLYASACFAGLKPSGHKYA